MKITTEMQEIRAVFPPEWMEDIEREIRNGCTVFVVDNKCGCLVKKFDGMNTLFYLWTQKEYRGQGLAQSLVKEVGEYNKPLPTFARYREDEEDVKRLFIKGDYEIIHKGIDRMWVVAYRTI